jgi:hypothetical protein
MGGAPRAEDELGAGPGLRHQADVALAIDQQMPIEALAGLDATARIGAAARTAGDLGPARAEADRVVARHGAPVAAAQHRGEVGGWPPPGRGGVRGRMGKAAIEVGEERGEEGVGGLEGRDALKPELDDEAVRQRAPEALNAALRLGRAGRDVADAEVVQDAAEVGRVLRALELFLERPVPVVADEDVEATPYSASGNPWWAASWWSKVT